MELIDTLRRMNAEQKAGHSEGFRYENYEVWRRSVDFAVYISKVARSMPAHEQAALGDTLMKTAMLIPSTIADGSAGGGKGDFLEYLNQARGYLNQVLTQIEIAQRLDYLDPGVREDARAAATDIARMLNAFRNLILKDRKK